MKLGVIWEKAPALRFHAHRLAMPFLRSSFGRLGEGSVIVSPIAIRGLSQMFIGRNLLVREHGWLQTEFDSTLTIGNDVFIGYRCHIHAVDDLVIGDRTMIANDVTISSGAHGADNHTEVLKDGPITIGRNVFIGEKVLIKGGISIGDDAVVGAGSVVTRDVPAGATVAGVPARVLSDGSVPRSGT